MTVIAIDEMIEPVERFFEREFPAERSLFTDLEGVTQQDPHATADLAYVQGTHDALHAVCVAQSYAASLTDVHGGIHASSGLDANFSWLVMPLDEFRHGDDMCNGLLESLCQERGVGLITVQPSGLGLSAKVLIRARRRKGRFMESYDTLPSRWKQQV